MILATPLPRYRPALAPPDIYHGGAHEVHSDILHWGVRSGGVRKLLLLAEGLSGASPLPDFQDALTRFPRTVRDRATVIPFSAPPQSWQDTDILLGRAYEAPGLVILRRTRQCPAPVMGLIHSSYFPHLFQTHISLITLCEPADVLVAPSLAAKAAFTSLSEQARDLMQVGPTSPIEHRMRARLEVIPYGIDPRFLSPCHRGAARKLLGIQDDAVIFLYFGRLSPEYKADLQPLLRAFKTLADSNKNCLLLLGGAAGGLNYETKLRGLAGHLGIDGKLLIMPDATDVLRDVALGAADVFVSPVDNIQESYGLSILEAMAAGLPVICSDWSGYRELVTQGSTGFRVPTAVDPFAFEVATSLAAFLPSPYPEHCISMRTVVDVEMLTQTMAVLCQSAELRLKLGAMGQQRVRNEFTWTTTIQRFVTLWAEQRKMKDTLSRQPPINLGRAFSDYPSTTFAESLTVVRSTDAVLQELTRALGQGDPRLEIVNASVARPRSVQELRSLFPASSIAHLFPLMKQGYLRIIGHASHHRSSIQP